jgi:pimeloyl-ACP methyl ester carboxylesterase
LEPLLVLVNNGVVYVVDGAGGSGFTPLVLRRSLAHLPYEVRHFRWGTGYGRILSDLTNRENIRQKASELSRSITEYREQSGNEDCRVYVVAKSAGTAVALWALTELAPDTVERAILLSPAVSPTFPLVDALRAVRSDLINFWSPNDLFFLGLGTSLFGTADGVFCKSAGLTGFAPKNGNSAIPRTGVTKGGLPSDGLSSEGVANDDVSSEYAKLRQIKWDPSMIKFLHLGTHSGNSMPPFVNKYIVPLLQ